MRGHQTYNWLLMKYLMLVNYKKLIQLFNPDGQSINYIFYQLYIGILFWQTMYLCAKKNPFCLGHELPQLGVFFKKLILMPVSSGNDLKCMGFFIRFWE